MTIKSDLWIRRMAEQHGLIEPYEPGQVREANGRKLVSYGTSSYGYDVRCADEFKIFTNINSAVLDPKQFDYLCSREEEESDAHWEREWQLHRLRWALRAVAGSFEPMTLQAFEMHVLGGRPVEETAAALGISAGSVYQAKSRVLKGLKQRLATLDPEGDI